MHWIFLRIVISLILFDQITYFHLKIKNQLNFKVKSPLCFSERNGPITLMELILLESNYAYCVYYVYSVDNINFFWQPSQKSGMFFLFFVCFLSEVCFFHVFGNGWCKSMFYVCIIIIGFHSIWLVPTHCVIDTLQWLLSLYPYI